MPDHRRITSYRFALFLHLLGAILFFAGMAVAGVAVEAARRREHAREVADCFA